MDWQEGNKAGGEIHYYRTLARSNNCRNPRERWPCLESTHPHTHPNPSTEFFLQRAMSVKLHQNGKVRSEICLENAELNRFLNVGLFRAFNIIYCTCYMNIPRWIEPCNLFLRASKGTRI